MTRTRNAQKNNRSETQKTGSRKLKSPMTEKVDGSGKAKMMVHVLWHPLVFAEFPINWELATWIRSLRPEMGAES